MKTLNLITGILFLVAVGCFGSCAKGEPQQGDPTNAPTADQTVVTKLDIAELPNTLRLSKQVYSGGQPTGEAGFKALQRLGVKTVISVDGAKPELATAKKFGLAYVHLPHGYDGISPQRAIELAKAVNDLPGPVYIHCHHGKHRSPAAAAVACIGAGIITPETGKKVLKLAGTSSDYQGLHEVVARSQTIANLNAVKANFKESVDVPPLAASMVKIEQTFDHLKDIQQSGWRAPKSHPDLSPEHEALLLREHFTELLRTKHVRAQPLSFRNLIEHSRDKAEVLEKTLRSATKSKSPPPKEALSAALSAIASDCKSCHREHRDKPTALGDR